MLICEARLLTEFTGSWIFGISVNLFHAPFGEQGCKTEFLLSRTDFHFLFNFSTTPFGWINLIFWLSRICVIVQLQRNGLGASDNKILSTEFGFLCLLIEMFALFPF